MGLLLQDMNSMVRIAMAIERENEDSRSIRDAGASVKRKESQPSSSQERRRRLLLHEGFKDRVIATKAKARNSIPRWETLQGS